VKNFNVTPKGEPLFFDRCSCCGQLRPIVLTLTYTANPVLVSANEKLCATCVANREACKRCVGA
jgi:uncharacterized protein CbrC (UPF0167 family)